jgi:hypothetical protein
MRGLRIYEEVKMSEQFPHHPRTKRGFKRLSEEFIVKIKRYGSIKKLAEKVEINIQTLRQWLGHINRASVEDPRVFKLAEMVGFPKEKVFEVGFE